MSLALTVRLFLSCLVRSLAELRKKREEKWEDQTKDRRVRVCVLGVIQLIPRWRTYVEQSTFASRLFHSLFARAKVTADADVGLEEEDE